MRLEFENSDPIEEPDDAAIAAGLATLGEENSFAILTRDNGGFIQAAGDPAAGFVLEYLEPEQHVQAMCTDKQVSIDSVLSAFQRYAKGDDSWIGEHSWVAEKESQGCLPLVIFLLLSCGGGASFLL
jgi:hypothetical protein